MSIAAMLRQRCATGDLVMFKPEQSRRPPRRRLFLSRELHRDLGAGHSAIGVYRAAGHIRAALTRWVSGGEVYRRFLKRLDPPPPEVWEISITEPVVQWRVFCRFAEADTLVATAAHTRQHLGKRGSQAWQDATGACAA